MLQGSHSKDFDVTQENYSPVQNSYTALWQEYKDAKLSTTLLHIIDRIVDYHFILLCSYERAYLKNRVSEFLVEDTSKIKLVDEMLRSTYESPIENDSIDNMIYYPASNNSSDYKEAFRALFKAMGQEAHYAKMSGEGELDT